MWGKQLVPRSGGNLRQQIGSQRSCRRSGNRDRVADSRWSNIVTCYYKLHFKIRKVDEKAAFFKEIPRCVAS